MAVTSVSYQPPTSAPVADFQVSSRSDSTTVPEWAHIYVVVLKEQKWRCWVTSAMSTGQQRVNKGIWTGLTGVEQYGINEWYEKPFPLWLPCGEAYKESSQRTSCGL